MTDMLADAFARLAVCEDEPGAFIVDPARPGFAIRDLGIAAASMGAVGAFHLRARAPCAGPMGWHYHRLDFHMVYILRGWVLYRWQGRDEPVHARAGSCHAQPPRGAHNVIDYAPDLELIEITMPARYETVALGAPDGPL